VILVINVLNDIDKSRALSIHKVQALNTTGEESDDNDDDYLVSERLNHSEETGKD
jgi:hypothetical protein